MLNVYFKVVDTVTRPILNELREKRYRTVKYWFNVNDREQICYLRDTNYINHSNTDYNLTCYSWDIEQCGICPEYDGLEHLLWRSINEGTQFVCIDSCRHCNNRLVLFQDAQHEADYPQEFVKIPCFHTIADLMGYAQEQGVFLFSLKNISRFEKCTGISPVQGAVVYREKSTGHYWYMDMLHRNHYEVFDSTGKHHLGERTWTVCWMKRKEIRIKR